MKCVYHPRCLKNLTNFDAMPTQDSFHCPQAFEGSTSDFVAGVQETCHDLSATFQQAVTKKKRKHAVTCLYRNSWDHWLRMLQKSLPQKEEATCATHIEDDPLGHRAVCEK